MGTSLGLRVRLMEGVRASRDLMGVLEATVDAGKSGDGATASDVLQASAGEEKGEEEGDEGEGVEGHIVTGLGCVHRLDE